MSTIRFSFRPQSDVFACTDAGSSRYALGTVLATPAGEGEVFAAATDGRCATVTICPGEGEREHLMPPVSKAGLLTQLNGQWETTVPAKGKKAASTTTAPEVTEGRFPRLEDCFPPARPADNGQPTLGGKRCAVVTIDAFLLVKIAKALSSEEVKGLTLFIECEEQQHPNPGTHRWACPGAVAVLGANGIGAIMPVETPENVVTRYDDTRQEYVDARKALVDAGKDHRSR